MKRSTYVVMFVVALVGFGFSLAYAQRATSRRAGKKTSPVKAIPRLIQPRPPGFPSREQVLTKAREGFLGRGYEGTRVVLTPNSKGDEDVLKAVAKSLDKLDFAPPARIAHFQWLADDPNIRARGWTGNLLSVAPAGRGWRASVLFSPVIDHMGAGKTVITGDHVVETYLYDGFNVQYVGIAVPANASRSIIID